MRKNWKKRMAALLVAGSLAAVPMAYMNSATTVFAEETSQEDQENEWSDVLKKGYTLKQPESITCSAVRVDSKNMCFTYGNEGEQHYGGEWRYTATDDTVLKVTDSWIDRNIVGSDGWLKVNPDYKTRFDVQGVTQGTTEITFYRVFGDSESGKEKRDAFQTYRAEVDADGTLTMQLLVSYEQGEFSFFANGNHDGISDYSIEDNEIVSCEHSEMGGKVRDNSGKIYRQEQDGQQYAFIGAKQGTTKVSFHYTNCRNTLVSKSYEITVLEDKSLSVKEIYGEYDHLADLPIPYTILGYTQYYTIKDKEIAQLEETITVRKQLEIMEGEGGIKHYLFKGNKKGTTTFTFHEYRHYTNDIDTITQYEIKVDKELNATVKEVSKNQVGYVSKIDGKRKTTKTATIKIPKVKAVTGYQIVCATDSKFTKNKQVITTKKTQNTIKNLKKGKKYYVKVRGYRTVKGKKIYSMYSKVLEVAAK